MRTTLMQTFAVAVMAVVAVAGCGGGGSSDPVHHDAGGLDAAGFPSPPMLGAQIDRAGRPAVSTLLVGTFAAEPTRTAVKDAYRQAPDPAMWKSAMLRPNVSIEQELEGNLAMFDAIDAGMAGVPMAGCRNALRYTTPTGPTSYVGVADLFVDDQLYVDTSKPVCSVALALELEYGSIGNIVHTTCGGRTPTYDAIDAMYSIFAAGALGVMVQPNGDVVPLLHDNATVHGDVKDTFPYLGPPR